MTQFYKDQTPARVAPPVARESWFDNLDDALPEPTPAPRAAVAARTRARIDVLARAIRRETEAAHQGAERGELASVQGALANILAAAEQIRAICALAEST